MALYLERLIFEAQFLERSLELVDFMALGGQTFHQLFRLLFCGKNSEKTTEETFSSIRFLKEKQQEFNTIIMGIIWTNIKRSVA